MKVYITPQAHAEIMYHVHKANIEVSGLGRVEKTSNGDMAVTKIYLLKQESSSTTTDISQDEVSKLLYETREDKGDLNFWWHSHVDMDTFWSNTDMDTIKQFGKNGYLLSTVFNKKGKHRTSYYQGNADKFYPSVWIDKISTSFAYLPSKEEVETWDKEHEEKCTVKKMVNPLKHSNTDMDTIKQFGIGLGDDYPLNHNNKDFWEMPKEVKDLDTDTLEYSGLSATELIDEVSSMYAPNASYEFYSAYEQFVWWDFYLLTYGYYPIDDSFVFSFVENCNDVEYFNNCISIIGENINEREERTNNTRSNTNTRRNRKSTKVSSKKGHKRKRANSKSNDKNRKTTKQKN